MKKIIILILLSGVTIFGCKKEETRPTQSSSNNTNNSSCDPNIVLSLELNDTILDGSCNAHSITNNGVTFTADRNSSLSKALNFDGTGYLNFPNASSLKPNFPLTISFWINVNDSSDWAHNYFLQSNQRSNGGYNGYFVRTTASGAIYLTVSDTVSNTNLEATTSHILPSNAWVHYAAIVTSNNSVQVYWNGVRDTSANVSGNINSITYPSSGLGVIGGVTFSSNNGRLKGKMDKIIVYKKALTANEIQSLYNSTE